MGKRSLFSSFLWISSLVILVAAVAGCLASSALAGGMVGIVPERPLVNAYSSLWPCLALLYFGYLAALEQTPEQEQESADLVMTATPTRAIRLRLLLQVLFLAHLTGAIALVSARLTWDWPAVVFGLIFPLALLAFFTWHVRAYTADYQASQGPSKLALAWHNIMYVSLCVIFGFHAAGWAMYGRYDLVVWDALAAMACLTNIYLIDARSYGQRIRNKKGKLYREVELRNPLEPRVVVEQEFKKILTWRTKTALYINLFLKGLFILLTVLLVNGALYQGSGMQVFYGLGITKESSTLSIDPQEGGGEAGMHQKIHYKCQGQSDPYFNLPTLILEGGASRDLTDLAGLFSALASQLGFRTCAFDKPGLGGSDPLRLGQFEGVESYYGKILKELSHKEDEDYAGPYILVGLSESAGRLLYSYASSGSFEPSLVHSITLFRPTAKIDKERLKNITEMEFLKDELSQSLMFNSVLTPFGLGPYIVTDEDREIPADWRLSYGYYLPHDFGPYWDLWDVQQKIWADKSEKHWNTKYWEAKRRIHQLEEDPEFDVFKRDFPEDIKVNVVTFALATEAAANQCVELDLDDEACEELWTRAQSTGVDKYKSLAERTWGAVVEFEEEDFSEGDLLFGDGRFKTPNDVVKTLQLDIYTNEFYTSNDETIQD